MLITCGVLGLDFITIDQQNNYILVFITSLVMSSITNLANIVNHELRTEILEQIRTVRIPPALSDHSDNRTARSDLELTDPVLFDPSGNYYRGLIPHFKYLGILPSVTKISQNRFGVVIDFTRLDAYLLGERALEEAIKRTREGTDTAIRRWEDTKGSGTVSIEEETDVTRFFQRKETYSSVLEELKSKGEIDPNFLYAPFVHAFRRFSPDIIAHPCSSGNHAFASHLASWLGSQPVQLYEVRVPKDEIEEERGSNRYKVVVNMDNDGGALAFQRNSEGLVRGKNVLLLDTLLDPYTTLGMAKLIQSEGGKVMGIVGIFSTFEFSPDYAFTLAKVNIEGWNRSQLDRFSLPPLKRKYFSKQAFRGLLPERTIIL